MTTSAVPSHAGYRFPAEIISHAVWLYFRLPLSLRMVGELPAARHRAARSQAFQIWAEVTGVTDAGVVTKSTAVDSTYIKTQRAASGTKGALGASDRAIAWRLDAASFEAVAGLSEMDLDAPLT